MDPLKQEKTSSWKDFAWSLFFIIIIVIPIRTYVAKPFIVNGDSMFPTFETGQYLIVDQLSYNVGKPARGDVAIFKYPYATPGDPAKYYIKRIIGLPGETIEIEGSVVKIFDEKNGGGFVLDEQYIEFNKESDIKITLEKDEYFVMGDNRAGSSDSRSWGPLQKDYLVGKAFIRLLPISKFDYLPGNYKYNK